MYKVITAFAEMYVFNEYYFVLFYLSLSSLQSDFLATKEETEIKLHSVGKNCQYVNQIQLLSDQIKDMCNSEVAASKDCKYPFCTNIF